MFRILLQRQSQVCLQFQSKFQYLTKQKINIQRGERRSNDREIFNKQSLSESKYIRQRIFQHGKRQSDNNAYQAYDRLIQQYKNHGNDIDPVIMANAINNSKPSILRSEGYLTKLKNVFSNCADHFRKNPKFYSFLQWSQILLFYSALNLHRKEVFEVLQKLKSKELHPSNSKSALNMYRSYIQLHHEENPQFKKILKNRIFDTVTSSESLQVMKQEAMFDFAVRSIRFFLMDKDFQINKVKMMIEDVQNNIIPRLKNVSLIQRNFGSHLAILYELLKLHKVQIKSQKFLKILQSALKYQISQKQNKAKKFIKVQKYQVKLDQDNIQLTGNKPFSQNTERVVYGQSSVFESIFARLLNEHGYSYDKNVLIGMFEYDFIIKGQTQKKYLPFQKNKRSVGSGGRQKPITQEEWKMFKSMKNLQFLPAENRFESQVIINLNGPFHYIDSDVYGLERSTRTDEIKRLIVKNYGYKQLNQIHYAKWEQIHKEGYLIGSFIQNTLNVNLLKKYK